MFRRAAAHVYRSSGRPSALPLSRKFSSMTSATPATPAMPAVAKGAVADVIDAKIVAASEADNREVAAALYQLLPGSDRSGGRWSLTAAGDGVERSFQFKTFAKTWDFMTAVALQCKLKNHHPEWSNVYNTTFVRWTTHHPTPGLTRKDTDLAAICDALARDFGEVVPAATADEKSAPQNACELQGLANQAKIISGGDCCTPKTKTASKCEA